MTRRNLYNAVFAIVSVFVLAIGGFAQGKGHGGDDRHGGGNPHGGGNGGGNGRSEQVRQHQPPEGGGQRQGGNPHGNGGGGDQQRQVWAQQRAVQQQQQRGAQQQQWQQQRAVQQQQRAAEQQQWQQQRAIQQQQRQQGDWARGQQRQNDVNSRRQEQSNQQAWRQQQDALRQQFRQQYIPAQPQRWNGHDNGRHNGWTDNGPRGNAYGLRGMAPGQNRDMNQWNSWANQQQWQQRRDRDRDGDRRNRAQNYSSYYGYDPLATWAPQIYRSYSSNNYGYNNGYNNYGYNDPSYYTYSQPRSNIVRTIISSFFGPQDNYSTFYNPPYYSNSNYGYTTPQYYYSNAGYSPGFGSGYYDSGYNDPYGYGGVPMFASPFYGDNSLKSSLLNLGVQMLQGFLGQGYSQGLNDAQYVRATEGPVYYDPYQASEPAYYSPYASSFADQRQVFEQGYRLGYEDAMRNQDPYGAYGNNGRVDLLSQFLANSVLGS